MDGGLDIVELLLQVLLELFLSFLGLLHESLCNLMYLKGLIIELMIDLVELKLQNRDFFHFLPHFSLEIPQL